MSRNSISLLLREVVWLNTTIIVLIEAIIVTFLIQDELFQENKSTETILLRWLFYWLRVVGHFSLRRNEHKSKYKRSQWTTLVKLPVLHAACYIMNYMVKLDLLSFRMIYKSCHSVCGYFLTFVWLFISNYWLEAPRCLWNERCCESIPEPHTQHHQLQCLYLSYLQIPHHLISIIYLKPCTKWNLLS